METTDYNLLNRDLESKGFSLDFVAKTDLDGVFEYKVFSDGTNVVILTGEGTHSMKDGGKIKMAYRHYCCQIGNDEYLKRFLEYEIVMRNPSLLKNDCKGLFDRFINKIKSYGTKDINLSIQAFEDGSPIKNDTVVKKRRKNKNVYDLSNYRKTKTAGQNQVRKSSKMN